MSTPPWRTRCSPACTLVAIHLPAQPGSAQGRHHHLRVAGIVVNEKDADRHGDARLLAQLQEPYPAACRSRYRRGQDRARGTSTLASLQFCACGGEPERPACHCAEKSPTAHTIWNNIGLGVVLLCSVRGRRLGTRVFAPQGFSPWGFAPLGCFCRNALASGARPHAMQSFSVNQYLRQHIRTVPDWPAPGVQFRDITPCCRTPRCSAC